MTRFRLLTLLTFAVPIWSQLSTVPPPVCSIRSYQPLGKITHLQTMICNSYLPAFWDVIWSPGLFFKRRRSIGICKSHSNIIVISDSKAFPASFALWIEKLVEESAIHRPLAVDNWRTKRKPTISGIRFLHTTMWLYIYIEIYHYVHILYITISFIAKIKHSIPQKPFEKRG